MKESDRAYRGIKIARYTMKRKKDKDRSEMYVHQFDGEKNDAFGEINCGHIRIGRELQMSAANCNREGRRGASDWCR